MANKQYKNFHELCEQEARRTTGVYASEARGYLVEGKNPLKLAIQKAQKRAEALERQGKTEEVEKIRGVIKRAEETGMIDGSFEITYEGSQRIYNKVRQIVEKTASGRGQDYTHLFDSFDPITDHDLIATGIFCLIPEVRDYVRNNADSLYKIVLTANSGRARGYSLPVKHKTTSTASSPISPDLKDFISALPQAITNEEAEMQRRLNLLLDKKAERESFPLFKQNPGASLERLEQLVSREQNQNLREAYQRLLGTYTNYMNFKVLNVNPNFVDPATGKRGVLPSLHQRSALYHLITERKLGIFDGCGTGKTAISILAAPIIEKITGKPAKVFVACPNGAKRAWKKGLVGSDEQRYLATRENILVVNGERKDEEFMRRLGEAKWVIANYDQLISRAEEELFVDLLERAGFNYVIFDEGHHIKSRRETTKRGRPTLSAAAQRIANNADYLAILTASPIADTLDDYGVLAHLLQPEKFPRTESLRQQIGHNPRVLYTFFNEKSVRRTAEDINDELDWEEHEKLVALTPEQQKIYQHLVEFRPAGWMIQARKALLDPRLVDPEVLQRAGVLGQVTVQSSAKYQKLEQLLTQENGPVMRGDKFIVFSSMFREGVTQKDHAELRRRYKEIGKPELYAALHLERSLDTFLADALKRKTGKGLEVAIIDGTVLDIEERERTVDRLSDGLAGIVCTTDTGGESLDFTAANYVVFLDEDYTPKTAEQALSRVVRKGQKKKVDIVHLRAEGTLDEDLRDYVEKKRIITQTAMDGHPLTPEEWKLLEDTEGKRLGEMIRRGLGGVSINTYDAEIKDIEDFRILRRIEHSRRQGSAMTIEYNTTYAQELMRWIGQDPINCWSDPKFVELYMKTLPNLAVPVMHLAKVGDLVRRSQEGEIVFPRRVLSDGSGPSLLYDAYQTIKPLITRAGLEIPDVTDRDMSQLMLARGKNPNKVLGNMNGENSAFSARTFDMVDNESITLLPNPEQVKQTLLESHRILRDEGLIELVVKNMRFSDGFYSGMEKLGFETLSEKNQGFALSTQMFRRLKQKHGEHFAEAYANKLADTYILLARKVDNPSEANASDFWFEKGPIVGDNVNARAASESRSIIIPGRRRPRQEEKTSEEEFTPQREVITDKSGVVKSVKRVGEKDEK